MMFAAIAIAGCLTLNPDSDRILAADLAPEIPAMAGLPAGTEVGFAPAPGVTRVFRIPELRMLATRFRLDFAPAKEVCVVRRVAPLTADRLKEAMRRTLPEASIELLEFSRQPAPEGDIEFPLAGLRTASAAELWTGFVNYAGNRRFTVWAKVKVRVRARRVLAIGNLPAGTPIAAGQVMAMEREEFPTDAAFAASVEEVAGKWPRLTIRAGSAIRLAQLEYAKDVTRGDTVTVEVRDGAASLKLEAVAQGSGAAGESILVRNPNSQKCFRARVEGKGRASVDAAPKINP